MYLICGLELDRDSVVRCRGDDCSVASVGEVWRLVETTGRGEEGDGRLVEIHLTHWGLHLRLRLRFLDLHELRRLQTRSGFRSFYLIHRIVHLAEQILRASISSQGRLQISLE